MTTAEVKTHLIDTAAETIEAHPKCAGVTKLDDALEIRMDARSCPPAVLRMLSTNRLHIAEARPRESGYHVLAHP